MDLLKSFFTVLRWVEAVTILLLALRAVPAVTTTFVNFMRIAFSVINSPCFLFVVGNGIVLLLFFKYRNLNNDDDITNNGNYNSEVYDGMIRFLPPPPVKAVQQEEEEEEKKQEQEVAYEDKEVVSTGVHRGRVCRRSKSERKLSPKIRELKRSKTDMVPEDDSEEFRRTIEAFIEKQIKFQREESKSILSMSTTTAAEMPTNALAIVSAATTPDEGKEKE